MQLSSVFKNRFVLLVIVLLISFGLVGAALAAAGQMGRSVAQVQAIPPQQAEGGVLREQLAPPSPMQTSYQAPAPRSPADPLLEQMRLKTMSGSPYPSKTVLQDFSYGPEIEAGLTAPSMAPPGIDGGYIPNGIVVDTYLDYIYGYVSPYEVVTILRTDGAYGAAEADDTGFFWTSLFAGAFAGTPVDIAAGDEFNINGSPFIVGQEPTGYLLDSLVGSIPGDTGGTEINVTLGSYGQPSSAYGLFIAMTDANGNFSITFPFDPGPENFAVVDTLVTGGFQRTYLFPDRVALVQQHGIIAGYAERGSVVTATVKKFDDYNGDPRWGPNTTVADSTFGWFTFYDVTLDFEQNNGDKVVVEFPGGTSEWEYIYASHFTFSGDDTVSGNLSHANRAVRLSFLEWDDGDADYIYRETTTTSDVDGNFSATFAVGEIQPATRVDVAVMDGGAGSYMITGKPYVEVIVDPTSDWDCVRGRVDMPNAPLTLELERGGQVYPRERQLPPSDPGNQAGGDVCYIVWQDDQPMNFLPGDILRLGTTDGWSGEMTVYEVHYAASAETNFIDGYIFTPTMNAGEIAFRVSPAFSGFFPLDKGAEARAEIMGGSFLVPFSNFDVRSATLMNSFIYDPDTQYAMQTTERNHFFRTMGNQVVWGNTYIPNEPIELYLLDPQTGVPIYTSTNDVDGDPYGFYFDFQDCDPVCAPTPPLQEGVIVEVYYDWSGEGDNQLIYHDISVDGDAGLNIVTANGYEGMVDLYGGFENISFDRMVPTLQSGAVLNTQPYDLELGDSVDAVFQNNLGNRQVAEKLLGEIRRVEFWMNPNNMTWLWGTAQPGSEVVVKTSRGDTIYGYPEPLNGNWGVDHATLLLPGDLITVTAGEGFYPVVITIPDVWANSDSEYNTVSGHTGIAEEKLVEIYPWDWSGMITTTTDVNGEFSALLADVPPQGRGHIRFIEEFGVANVDAIFHRPFYDLAPVLQVNYGHDWVENQYDPGYSVAITLTDKFGALKATAHGTTSEIPWWNGDFGYSTNYNVPWDGPRPDLTDGDFVYLNIEGRTSQVQLGEIGGELDVDNDRFDGYINAPWLSDPVWVDCGVWVENGPGMGVGEVDPNGGIFTCDFTELGWDLQPGQDVGVSYNDPDGNKVINVFSEPAPHLWINLETHGEPVQGSNYALRVHYNNDGQAKASGVVITQTLYGMTYLSDTSGFPRSGSGSPGDPLVWEVGEVPVNYYSDSSFVVFVRIDDFSEVASFIDINTTTPYYQGDPWNLHFEWYSGVFGNTTDLNIGKWAWTWGPVPGQEFVYAVNVCNNGSTSSSEVFITDTLPLSTTLVDWWGVEPGWEPVVEDPHLLVVKRPTVDGYRCSEVNINVLLSAEAWKGIELFNQAHVGSSSDIDPFNNDTSMTHQAWDPEYNLHLSPNWVQGQFVPGGEVSYELNYSNWGNMPVPGTVLTTTVPEGMEFIMAYTWDWRGWLPITDTIVGDGYLRWEIGDFLNGYNTGLGIRFKIANETQPGTPLVVENEITGDAIEYRYDDNKVVYNQVVNSNGPNLRIDKHTNWYWNNWWDEFNNKHQLLEYELRITNVGTQNLEDPIVTDTLPISTTFVGCWWNHGPIDRCGYDEANHWVTYTLYSLYPGETASAMVKIDLLPEYVDVQGLAFVNQVDISDFGDIVPADNHDEVIAYTGLDTFVTKWLKEGDLRAGELITYTVDMGNLNRWPINFYEGLGSVIIDTIPEGTTYERSILYLWADDPDAWVPEINGRELTWEFGPWWPDVTFRFDLVLRIDEDTRAGTELLNTIEAWSNDPLDIDTNPANNHFEHSLKMILYNFMLPIAQKSP